jgi:Ca2+-binding EF-hand superfamily protein
MGKWGKRVREHISCTDGVRSDRYVDYKILKKGIRSCTVSEFEILYIAEVLKFVSNIEEGVRDDPQFVEVNLKSLRNARKKFDKFHRRTYEERMGFHDFSDKGGERSELKNLETLLSEYIASNTSPIRFRIRATERFAQKVFEELTRDVEQEIKVLTREQMSTALQRLGLPASSETVDELMRVVDRDGDGLVNWQEFKKFMSVREPQVRVAFLKMDTESKGYILPHQIVHALKLLNVRDPKLCAEKLVEASKDRRQRSSNLWLRDLNEIDAVNTIETNESDGIDYLTFREMVR